MNPSATITLHEGSLVITGELNFLNIMSLWKTSLPLLEKLPELHFDLSQVTSCKSAALALLLNWIRYSKEKRKNIRFSGLSDQLIAIAKIGGVEKMLLAEI